MQVQQHAKHHLDELALPQVAKTPKEAIVGPTLAEQKDNLKDWHSKSSSGVGSLYSRKRKRSEMPKSSSEKNNSTITANTSFDHAMGTFLASGCCVIPNSVLPPYFVKEALEKATDDLSLLEAQVANLKQQAIAQENPNLLAQVGRGDFREILHRDGGRRDVRFQLDRFPFTARGLVYNPIVYPLVQALLGCNSSGGEDEICLLYAGVMWAKPNESDDRTTTTTTTTATTSCEDGPQKWHADGGHLFDHVHLPPHCINVFYPLVNLTSDNGPTEFVPGSHRLGCFDSTSNNEHFGLTCDAGGAILFDYRIKHRGAFNQTKEARPILYLAYCKPFYKDTGNARSELSVFHRDQKTTSIRSPPWVSRMLIGAAETMGSGFTNEDLPESSKDDSETTTSATVLPGSGERWVLFRMNVELPNENGEDEAKTITVYHGDIASEVSSRFCKEQGLDESFVPVLAGAIQQQMDTVTT
ncbi:unnamed protein product [Cylindrotheca closterium]|uniref:Uncharacterized protein n=1 Tax=Cylindrotheca closterium TaxID=2856 RepID=A0AAD2GDR5_9STRA|nr:unnamed protein product [Cylindrotheca closterium]